MRSLTAVPHRPVVRLRSGAARLLGRSVAATREFTPLLDAKGAGRLLGVPHTWLLAQARAGRIPHHRLGHLRFDIDDLRQWLKETRSGPPLDPPTKGPDC